MMQQLAAGMGQMSMQGGGMPQMGAYAMCFRLFWCVRLHLVVCFFPSGEGSLLVEAEARIDKDKEVVIQQVVIFSVS